MFNKNRKFCYIVFEDFSPYKVGDLIKEPVVGYEDKCLMCDGKTCLAKDYKELSLFFIRESGEEDFDEADIENLTLELPKLTIKDYEEYINGEGNLSYEQDDLEFIMDENDPLYILNIPLDPISVLKYLFLVGATVFVIYNIVNW